MPKCGETPPSPLGEQLFGLDENDRLGRYGLHIGRSSDKLAPLDSRPSARGARHYHPDVQAEIVSAISNSPVFA